MAKKQITIVDDNDRSIGETATRDEIHRRGLRHRVAAVAVYNLDGEILEQKRAPHKRVWGDQWIPLLTEHVDNGDTYRQTALRGLATEYGMKESYNHPISQGDLDPLTKLKLDLADREGGVERVFLQPYSVLFTGREQDLIINNQEVENIRFTPLEKVQHRLEKLGLQEDYAEKMIGEIRSSMRERLGPRRRVPNPKRSA